LKAHLKKYFLSGLIVVVPISITIYILIIVIKFTDKLYPTSYLSFYFPGFGIIITLCIILLVGIVTTNIIGKRFISIGERIIARIPMVKAIYHSIKQIAEAIFSTEDKGFRRVVLIEYPRKGVFAMAFVTGITRGEVQEKTDKKVLNVFVPTTPNPTSGFYLMVPEDEVTELSITPEEAFRLIVSGGMASK
jgi:uncharacterized membrane protein